MDAIAARTESPEVWNLLSAIRDRIGAVLVALLIFSIVLAIAGFVASYDGRRKMAAFESDGRSAIATITKKYQRSRNEAYWTRTFHGGADDQEYTVELCFSTQGAGYHCGTMDVPGGTYDGMRVGSLLKVTYVPWRPDWFYVDDNPPADQDSDIFARMFQLCTIAALLVIIVLAAMVFWQTGDGRPRRSASAHQASDVALRFRQQHGFTRRRWAG